MVPCFPFQKNLEDRDRADPDIVSKLFLLRKRIIPKHPAGRPTTTIQRECGMSFLMEKDLGTTRNEVVLRRPDCNSITVIILKFANSVGVKNPNAPSIGSSPSIQSLTGF